MMKSAWLALPMVVWTAPAMAQPAQTAEENLIGHYYLQGVMETGSELLLRPDGRFQWYLSYGALDLFAEGTWRVAGDAVELVAAPSVDVPKPGFERLSLAIAGAGLIPPDGRGAYVRAREDGETAPD
ncbi:hypothetical protein GGR44_003073 [Sphingobium fontiphilum]|uniref:Uncharacterized protein n=1 Tax=Sphingobium fontiphilum TaxID=944425 RepID=A0A7W6DML1_9SPHN|nr:hypothetical protein [Sphingobium fontiphilum]MBB3983385.1 hypothetical protein [Sphingobium fontiphilum]